jgi:hypothetical protein
MTADREDAGRARAFELGAIGSLLKPFNVETLSTDIAALLETASKVMESPSRRRKVVIAFNGREKNRLMRKEIVSRTGAGAKIVLLSLSHGEELCDAELKELVASESLIYLQIRASLAAKLPFLQDLTPLLSDLKGFLSGEMKSYVFIFDDIHLLLHTERGEPAMALAHVLKEAFTRAADDLLFFFGQGNTRDLKSLSELAQVLVR